MSKKKVIPEIVEFVTTDEALLSFSPKKFNLLACPTITEPTPCYRIQATVLRFRAGTRDTYPVNGQYALAKPALTALAQAAGIRYGDTKIQYDNDAQPVATVTEYWESSPGQWVELPGTYALNPEAKLESMRLDATGLPEDTVQEIEQAIENQRQMFEKFGEQMAETGALLRPIRTFLGVAHRYSKYMLRRPFVAFRIVFRPEDDEALAEAQRWLALADQYDLVGEDGGEKVPEGVLKIARALLNQAHPGPPEPMETPDPAEGQRTYNERHIQLRKDVLQACLRFRQLDEDGARQWIRDTSGKTLERHTVAELLLLLQTIKKRQ